MRRFEGFQRGIDLGGWFSQCPHTTEHYDSFITEADLETVAGWGLDHVRLPIDYELLETAEGKPVPEGYARLHRIVDRCGALGLNVIIDLHKTAGYSFDAGEAEDGFFGSAPLQQRFYALWEEIARQFGQQSDRVAFELLNEVTDRAYSDRWNAISRECVRRVRVYAPETYILIGGYWNNAINAMPDLPMPYDDRIVYNFHFYEPLLFTHQGALWVAGDMPADFRIGYPGTAEEYTQKQQEMNVIVMNIFKESGAEHADARMFDGLFAKAAALAEARGTALYCGEYGVIQFASNADTLRWYTDIHAAFEKYGIGRAAWTYRGMHFGLTDAGRADIRDELIALL